MQNATPLCFHRHGEKGLADDSSNFFGRFNPKKYISEPRGHRPVAIFDSTNLRWPDIFVVIAQNWKLMPSSKAARRSNLYTINHLRHVQPSVTEKAGLLTPPAWGRGWRLRLRQRRLRGFYGHVLGHKVL